MYEEASQVANDVGSIRTVAIHSGKTVALVGESGSGKSTVISLLQRFYNPDSGSITLDGVELKKFQLKWLILQMGLVSQEPVLFNYTILVYKCRVGRNKVAIARAIVKSPKILLSDEATSALDAESESVVQDVLDNVMVNRTTVVVASTLR